MDVCSGCQEGVGVSGHGNNGYPEALKHRKKGRHFTGCSAVRHEQSRIALCNHSHVTVAGLGWVNKLGWGARVGQGRSNFAADMSTFAHAAHDDSAVSCGENVYGLGKLFVDA